MTREIEQNEVDELTKNIKCETLKHNIDELFKTSNLFHFKENDGNLFELTLDWATRIKPLKVFDELDANFWKTHDISEATRIQVKDALELQAAQYCIYTIFPDMSLSISLELKRLKKISSAAKKLKDLLPKPDEQLFVILTTIESIEVGTQYSKNIDVYFSNFNSYLDALIGMHAKIATTQLGQFTKLGSKSPQGNLALRVWIACSFIIWEEILGRSFKYDGLRGVSGPAKFANFAFDAILPLHTQIEFSQIEYAVRAFRENTKTRIS